MEEAYAVHRAGRLEEAEGLYRAVLADAPEHGAALHHLGLIRHQQGASKEGLALIDRAIALEPGDLQSRFNRITVLRGLGREDEIPEVYREAAGIHGKGWEDLTREARALQQQGRMVEAQHFCRMALALAPEAEAPGLLLGEVLLMRNRAAEAQQAFQDVLGRMPGHVAALCGKGRALALQGQGEEALAAYREALARDAQSWLAHQHLADLHHAARQYVPAAEHYRRSLELNPAQTRLQVPLGNTLCVLGRFAEAEACYREALKHHAGEAMVHNNLANALYQQNRGPEAESACRLALRIDPDLAESHGNLGNVLTQSGRYGEAEASYRRALELRPDYPEVQVNLGNLMVRSCRVEEGIECYRSLLARHPDASHAHSNMLMALNYRDPESLEALFGEHAAYGEYHEARIPRPASHANDPDPERPLRIGFVSPDLRSHPVGTFVEPLFRHHNPARAAFHCYSTVANPDSVTERLRGMVEHWSDLRGVPDPEAAESIRRDAIDILVDLTGHIGNPNLLLFARKPAPVQVGWMGYLNTTGLRSIDYWITDLEQNPPDTQAYFTETLYRLPRCFVCYPPPADAPPVQPPPLLRENRVTFGCFNNGAKISPRMVAVWARLLAAVPEARLLFKGIQFGNAEVQARVRGWFEAAGIAPGRLLFAPPSERAAYFADFARIDIALDPSPYNGNTSTNDALWMGVPVVSLAGTNAISRTGVSLLTHVGHPEWIAADDDAYVSIAAGLAADPDRLARLRTTLRDEMARSPLCDGPAFARAMEDAFREMWRRWCQRPNP